jgi:hypothetical protein
MLPFLFGLKPNKVLASSVFPAPTKPTMPTISPLETDNEIFFSF